MDFKPVTFESSKKTCPLPFAVTVAKAAITFRISTGLAEEGKIKRGDLYSLYYDGGPGLFALVGDPANKSGEARKMLSGAAKNSKKAGSLTIAFPRTDLLARIWKKEAKIEGLPLFEKRGPGKIVFHTPKDKI